MTRTQTRELAFTLLYSLEIQKISKEEIKEQLALFLQEQEVKEEKVKNYMEETIHGIEEHENEILDLISQNLKEKWDISRISKVSLTLLKLAIYEMIYAKLPYKVVVNEAVELAKKYGEDHSAFFVNGVLANIIKKFHLDVQE